MTRTVFALALALALAAPAGAADAPKKSVGLVPLQLVGLTPAQAEVVQGQARGTVAEFVGTARLDVQLGAKEEADDEEALRRAAVLQDVDVLLGGKLVMAKDRGEVVVVAVDKAGGPARRAAESFSGTDEALLLAAVEGATCHALGELTNGRGCQGTVELEGPPGTDFYLDGKKIPDAFSAGSVPVTVGEHKAAAMAGKLASQVRPVLVRLDKTVSMRAVERCGGLSLLARGESPGCGTQDPVVIIMPAEEKSLNWAAIGTSGAAVVALAASAVLFLQARSAATDFNARYHGSGLGPEDQAAYDGIHSKVTQSRIALGIGAAAGIAGGILFATDF